MKTVIKNELVAFKVPTPINKKIERFADLEMISKSDLIRRSVFANSLNLMKCIEKIVQRTGASLKQRKSTFKSVKSRFLEMNN